MINDTHILNLKTIGVSSILLSAYKFVNGHTETARQTDRQADIQMEMSILFAVVKLQL